jgi:hypothetical protein
MKLLPEENISRQMVGFGWVVLVAIVATAGCALIFPRPMRRLARFLRGQK